MNRAKSFSLAIAFLLTITLGILLVLTLRDPVPVAFDGQRALADVAYQMALGPRTPGSTAHDAAVGWMVESLQAADWEVDVQLAERLGHPIRNVVAKRGSGGPWYILGAHYDSRLVADHDPDPEARLQPVPGANDGASGVAVLLELARVLPRQVDGQIWLVLFDAEDNGGIEGWDWILGSSVFAESLTTFPDGVVIVDMIGDADLQIYLEANSDVELRTEIWEQAAALGHSEVFINTVKHSMLDDHTPFLRLGIPAIDIIDFDYPFWHTQADTLDKVSASSLQIVGDTLLAWLLDR
ncbi:MAG: M28 family peptidase [Anaerolineales bacterium]